MVDKVDVRARLRAKFYENPDQYPLRGNADEVKAYRAKTKEMEALFKKDLFEEFEIVEHPKRELLFSKSWELSHDSGLEEVYYTFSDLFELIK